MPDALGHLNHNTVEYRMVSSIFHTCLSTFGTPFSTVSLCCSPTWWIPSLWVQQQPRQVCVRMHSCSYAWAGCAGWAECLNSSLVWESLRFTVNIAMDLLCSILSLYSWYTTRIQISLFSLSLGHPISLLSLLIELWLHIYFENGELKAREAKWIAQGHTGILWQSHGDIKAH